MYKFHKGLLPDIFDEIFTPNKYIHTHFTRQSELLHVPINKSILVNQSLRYKGVEIWNKIKPVLPEESTYTKFKSVLYEYLAIQ